MWFSRSRRAGGPASPWSCRSVEVELAVRAVGCPARRRPGTALGVVAGDDPGHRAGEPVGGQRVDRRLEQAGTVSLAPLRGIERELGELAVGDRVAVGVGGGGR